MRGRLALIALTLALAALASTARADVFAVVPTPPSAAAGLSTPAFLPSFDTPNLPGSVALPASLSTPPAVPVELSSSQLLSLWQRAGNAYSIPWQVLAAINKVESNFGRNMGPSSAGAVGWMQFLPSTWAEWGVDANGDGVADPWNPDDAVFSAARYLAAAGGATDLPRAVYAYNHADWYVSEVLGLADLYDQGASTTFALDRLQVDLDAAQGTVAAASARLVGGRARLREALRVEAVWNRRANAEELLSARLADEQQAGLAAERASSVQALVARQTAALAAARAQLTQARQAAAPVSFSVAAAPLLGAPTYSGGYVFPVGGGPGVVSASHTHHDYPAVDIAAPAGSPVYALASGVIDRSWTVPDPVCGIGLTMQASDGQTWTYCHLAYLEPGIVAGVSVTAGEPVGLVGSTGDATGPHLHLQLQPPTAWPQQEQWFTSFAGTAFSWSDEPSLEPSSLVQPLRFTSGVGTAAAIAAPVFSIVPSAPAPSTPVVLFSRPGS
ncbi:MAG TPA: lytic murein transglycosylase [Gaiellaceae bacterium]|nr:lytic murein transglycosylase [Gaiellaceae bacterium]